MNSWHRYIVIFMMAISLTMVGCNNSKVGEKTSLGIEATIGMRYDEGIAQFEEAISQGEESQSLWRCQGIAYMGLCRYEEAVASFEKALEYSDMKVDYIDYDINYYLAGAYYNSGKYRETITTCDAIIGLQPKSVDAYYMRGSAKLKLENINGALEDFDKACELAGKDIDVTINVFDTLQKAGYKDNGKEYLTRVLAKGASDMSDYDMGRLLFFNENYSEATVRLEKARSQEKLNAVLYLGKACELLGDYNYATSVYSNHIQSNPGDAAVHNRLGLAKMSTGEYNEAKNAFLAGLEIGDNRYYQELSYNLIVAYEYLGDFENAKVLMRDYLDKYPSDEAAKRESVFIRSR